LPVLMDLKATEARAEMAAMVLRRAPQVSMAAMAAVGALVVTPRVALPVMAATEALVVLVLMELMARRGAELMD
jgi:hypothetical protein